MKGHSGSGSSGAEGGGASGGGPRGGGSTGGGVGLHWSPQVDPPQGLQVEALPVLEDRPVVVGGRLLQEVEVGLAPPRILVVEDVRTQGEESAD